MQRLQWCNLHSSLVISGPTLLLCGQPVIYVFPHSDSPMMNGSLRILLASFFALLRNRSPCKFARLLSQKRSSGRNGYGERADGMGVSNPPHLVSFSRQSKQKSPLSGADEQGRSFPCIYSSSLARLRCVNLAAPPGSEFTQVSLCTFSHVCNSVFCRVSYSPDSFHRRPAAASSILSSGGREPLVWRRKEKGLLSPSFLPSTSVGRRPIASFSPSERDGGLLWYPHVGGRTTFCIRFVYL